jgi:branched-chain amino acid transport system substrate-binding protein
MLSRKRIFSVVAMVALLGMVMPASSIFAARPAKSVIKIGVSVSLTGDFSGDGKAIQNGYNLWAAAVNKSGGMLGHKVQMVYKDDASSTTQIATNIQALINSDHVTFTFGPFSSLLTIPAARVAHRFGYAFPEPAGGGPQVFASKLDNIFFVQPAPVVDNYVSFAKWILSLPKSKRPKTAAYASEQDPFALPQIEKARKILEKGHIKTVTSGTLVFPAETPAIDSVALKIIKSKAQLVMIGTTGLPEGTAFIKQFIQQHYNPKALTEASGPDQGSQFSNAVGIKNTEGIIVPAGWWAGAHTFGNGAFVKAYLKAYGGNLGGITQDAAEAYSVGQVVAQAVAKDHSLTNAALIKELHKGSFQSIQGPMKFNKLGEPQGKMFLVQWRNGRAIPVYPANVAVKSPEYPKPKWH